GQRRPMHGGEIAKDRMGFPDHEIAVDQGRDLRGRIELAIALGQRVAELTTVILASIRNPEFFQTEDDLLHVSRRLPSEQSDHVILLSASVPSAADLKFLHRVPRIHLRNFKSKSGTRIIELLVPFGFRSSYSSVPRCITNFENRALVGVRQEEERMP